MEDWRGKVLQCSICFKLNDDWRSTINIISSNARRWAWFNACSGCSRHVWIQTTSTIIIIMYMNNDNYKNNKWSVVRSVSNRHRLSWRSRSTIQFVLSQREPFCLLILLFFKTISYSSNRAHLQLNLIFFIFYASILFNLLLIGITLYTPSLSLMPRPAINAAIDWCLVQAWLTGRLLCIGNPWAFVFSVYPM